MNLIAIDPSSTMIGFAYFENNNLIWAKTIQQKEDNLIDRMKIISKKLVKILNKTNPDYIAIETPYLGVNRAVSMKMGQIFGMLIATCTYKKYFSKDIIEVHPLTAKKAAGLVTKVKRAEGKTIVLAKLKELFPKIKIIDDNAADAVAVGLAAINKLKEKDI